MKTTDYFNLTILDVYKEFKEELSKVDGIIRDCLKSEDKDVNKMVKYLPTLSGKRLRPLLVLISASLNDKKNTEKDIILAAVMELIHTATLIHDDVIDEACKRRFKYTLNHEWGNRISVIFGDYLLSKSFLLLVNNFDQEILSSISQAVSKVCQGEIREQQRQYDKKLRKDEYLKIIEDKTASLISACCKSGALLGKSSEIEIKAMENYGLNIGIAFQIVDDCLDLISSEKELGKNAGNDLSKGRLTLPVIYLLNKDQEIDDIFNYDKKELMRLLKEGSYLEEALEVGKKYIKKAKKNLDNIEDSKVKIFLSVIANYVLKRRH
ncbi:MAG: polyprenyl synthetase family protein [bacterium]